MKADPIPTQAAVGETVMIGAAHLDGDVCRCGFPLWMHDRERRFDGEGRFFFKTVCPAKRTILPPDSPDDNLPALEDRTDASRP